jgi:phosphonate transport system substrate-binding protein
LEVRSVRLFGGLKAAAVATVLLLAVGCGGGQEAQNAVGSGGEPEKLRFAVTDLTGLEELQRDFEPFQETLSEALGTEIELFPVSDRTVAAAALESDQVDLVLTGPAEYVVLRERAGAIPVVGITRPNYRSLIAVPADSDIRSVGDMEGHSIALSDVGSTSGHLAPAKLMADAGLEPTEDVEMLTLGDAWGQAFLNGDTDAWGGNLLDWEETLQASERPESDFRVLKVGPRLPNDAFVARKGLSPRHIEDIRAAMLENEGEIVEAILAGQSDENDKYRGSEILPAENEDYGYMRGAYEAVGVEDFSEFVGD